MTNNRQDGTRLRVSEIGWMREHETPFSGGVIFSSHHQQEKSEYNGTLD